MIKVLQLALVTLEYYHFQQLLGQTDNVNTALSTGFLIESDVPVQVVYRLTSANNQALVTLKGRYALGTDFRPGSQTYVRDRTYNDDDRHFMSVMATEDNTQITIEGDFVFQGQTNQNFTITLQENESYVVVSNQGNNGSEFISGIHVTSTKPIAIIAGSQHVMTSVDIGSAFPAADAGIDQPTPIDHVGTEYIIVRGSVVDSADYAVIIANEDNTDVDINGVTVTNLDEGEVFEYFTPGDATTNVGEATYIEGSKPIYVYHVTGEDDEEVGMSAMPTIACNGSQYLEFPLFSGSDNKATILVPNDALPSLELNGASYTTFPTRIVENVPVIDWTAVTLDITADDNIVTADDFFSYRNFSRFGNIGNLWLFISI